LSAQAVNVGATSSAKVAPLLENKTVAETGKALIELVQKEQLLTSEVVDVILQKAVLTSASDVHIEPSKFGIRTRYRIDGTFQDLGHLPIKVHDQIVSRIKVLADLVSHRREISQEGRITISAGAKAGDFRVSIVPTVAGEKVVLRMFNPAKGFFDLEKLGYPEDLVRRLESIVLDLHGMVILTGPSGSGKTTTLYGSLQRIYQKKDQYASIVTIEDPVEYEFGIYSQIQVNRQVGLDFAKILAACLRQDPEVIMIGEIRDQETCEIALRASLTGHLVLTTIHSGSACEVITRILNMNIEPFIVASAITGVVAQRLCRLNCPDCKHEYTPDRAQIEFVERTLNRTDVKFMRGRGCTRCAYTGYRDRIPIAELLVLDDAMRSLILEQPSTSTLKKFAVGRGMRTLLEDGLARVAEGVTTLEEVLRMVSARESKEE
jgi:type II secretory ATPase GspE/PulE/Tfp pilus assembly ATPase PilB-like protein